jgi:chromosome segregation ATPase
VQPVTDRETRDTIPAPPPEEADPASLVAAELARLREELAIVLLERDAALATVRSLTKERDHARAELRHLREQLERLAARYGWM